MFTALAVGTGVLTMREDVYANTGFATVVSRENVTKATFLYEVEIAEGEPGAGEHRTFDSHDPLRVGQRVRLRWVGGNQSLQVASDTPAGAAAAIILFTYGAGMNLIGIRWALRDRAWLSAHPDLQLPPDRGHNAAVSGAENTQPQTDTTAPT